MESLALVRLHLKIDFRLEVISEIAFSILLANVTTYDRDAVKDGKRGLEDCKYGPTGRRHVCRNVDGEEWIK